MTQHVARWKTIYAYRILKSVASGFYPKSFPVAVIQRSPDYFHWGQRVKKKYYSNRKRPFSIGFKIEWDKFGVRKQSQPNIILRSFRNASVERNGKPYRDLIWKTAASSFTLKKIIFLN